MKRLLTYIIAVALVLPSFATVWAAETPSLNIQGDSYVVIEVSTGQVLIGKNEDKHRAPASITKILTCALTLEKGGLEKRVVMTRDSVTLPAYSTHIALEAGEDVSVTDLLYSTMLLSANDGANGLAQYTGGTLDNFVAMMNDQVKALGLENTHFNNAHGMDDPQHYTSANDMAVITRWALEVDGFRELFGAKEYHMAETNKKDRSYPFINQNAILHSVNAVYYQGVEGGKLGYTDNARHTIVTLAERGDMELICVVLGSSVSGKYSDTKALLDYCFNNYQALTLPAKNVKEFRVPVVNGSIQTGVLNIKATQDLSFIVNQKSTLKDLTFDYNIPEFYVEGKAVSPTLSIYDKNGVLAATLPMEYELEKTEGIPLTQVLTKDSGITKPAFTLDPRVQTAFRWLILIALEFFAVLLATRFVVQQYYKRKRAKRQSSKSRRGRPHDLCSS